MDRALKREPCLEDTDTIWFGKHRGLCLKDVPASYLMWWYEQNHDKFKNIRTPEQITREVSKDDYKNLMLHNYIWNSMEALDIELRKK